MILRLDYDGNVGRSFILFSDTQLYIKTRLRLRWVVAEGDWSGRVKRVRMCPWTGVLSWKIDSAIENYGITLRMEWNAVSEHKKSSWTSKKLPRVIFFFTTTREWVKVKPPQRCFARQEQLCLNDVQHLKPFFKFQVTVRDSSLSEWYFYVP